MSLLFTLIAVVLGFIALPIFIIHSVDSTRHGWKVHYETVPFSSPKVTDHLDGFKTAFIVDTHKISRFALTNMVNEINNSGGVDLLVLGGDFPSGKSVYRSMKIISGINSRYGIYGVEGNHDTRLELFDAMETNGITPLLNSGVPVTEGLFLAGLEDLWVGQPDVSTATQHAKADDFVIMLSHNPDIVMEQDMTPVDLTLAGHTHGGQIVLFGKWAPALSRRGGITKYGQRFRSGMCYNDHGHPVYVSNGTGCYSFVPRVFAPPQLITIELKKA